MNKVSRRIEMQFPVLRYHAPFQRTPGVVETLEPAWLDAPKSIWGSHDGSDTYRHGGYGLSRNANLPSRASCLPGGVLDSMGRDFPILDIDASENAPKGFVRTSYYARLLIFGPFEYRFTFGAPEQLEFGAFKQKVTELNKAERGTHRFWDKIQDAQTIRDVMIGIMPPVVFDHYYKAVSVVNH